MDNTPKKRGWLPKTQTAKWAVGFAVATIIFGVLLPNLSPRTGFGGSRGVIMEIILAIVSLILSIKAIFGEKDRSILTLIVFIIFCIVGGFWIFFTVGEISVALNNKIQTTYRNLLPSTGIA